MLSTLKTAIESRHTVIKRVFLLGLGSVLTLIPTRAGVEDAHPIQASLIQLIATPERFDGKLISTSGFISIERESTLLYLDEQSFTHALTDNAIWFYLDEQTGRDRQKLNRNYVVLVGVFRNQRKGPGTNPNGGVDPIRRCAVWSLANPPQKEKQTN
jgi:hypothetical protein